MKKLILLSLVVAACGGPKSAPASKTEPPTAQPATGPATAGCPSVTFSCALKEKHGTDEACLEGGADFADAMKAKCTAENDGTPSDGPCVRTRALGGCTTMEGVAPGLKACTTMWVVNADTVKTPDQLKAECEKAKGTFIAN